MGGRASGLHGMRALRWAPIAVVAAALLVPAWSVPVAAQRSLVLERFHADIQVERSGDLLVTETLRPRFTGEWNGIRRHVSLNHTTASGERARLQLRFLSATDGDGRALRAEVNEVDSDTREFRVWVPDARDRTAEVVIRYRVAGAVRHFAGGDEVDPAEGAGAAPASDGLAEDYDEIYWQVTGTEWEVPIREASARVILPPGAMPLQAAGYRGDPSSREPVEVALPGPAVELADPEVAVPASGYLAPGEGLTLAVAWPAGHVPLPSGVARAAPVRFGPTGSVADAGRGPVGRASPLAWLPLLLPLLAFWLAYRAWDRRGRDPRERAITVRWGPPADLSPAEAGSLVDHDPGMHDLVSTLVDLAVRGYLVIEEREKKGFLQSGKDYAFHLVRPRTEWGELSRHESLFLGGLFSASGKSEVLANLAAEGTLLDTVLEGVAGEPASETAPLEALDSVLLSDLQNQFYKKIPEIKDALLDGLVRKGYYLRRPDRVRALWGTLTGAAFFTAFAGFFPLASDTATGYRLGISLMVGGILSGLILLVFTIIMPARTEKGARTREQVLGFKRFLERVESPRYRRMIRSPEQFEEYLPFAMAFRCADKWAKAFDDLLSEPPDWYHGRHSTFQPSLFASDLGSLSSTASSTLASSPSSSGSGGGGSVGGGSGGGGGGGF